MESKLYRVKKVNDLLEFASNHGRNFFRNRYNENVARMEVDEKTGHIYFIDDYTEDRIYTHYSGRWRGFSHGGTLKWFIEELRDYIQSGEPIKRKVLGPAPDWIPEDMWGYGLEDMKKVRDKAIELNIYSHGMDN